MENICLSLDQKLVGSQTYTKLTVALSSIKYVLQNKCTLKFSMKPTGRNQMSD